MKKKSSAVNTERTLIYNGNGDINNYFISVILKIIYIFLLEIGLCFTVINYYSLPVDYKYTAVLCLLFTIAFYFLFTRFGILKSLLIILVFLSLYYWILRSEAVITRQGIFFRSDVYVAVAVRLVNWMLGGLKSGLLSGYDLSVYLPGAVDIDIYLSEKEITDIATIILISVLCFLISLLTYKKIKVIPISVLCLLLLSATLVAGTAYVCKPFFLLLAVILSMYVMNIGLIFKSHSKENGNKENKKNKVNKEKIKGKKINKKSILTILKENSEKYDFNYSTAVIFTLIMFISSVISTNVFAENEKIDYQGLYDVVNDISADISDLFNFRVTNSPFHKYFTTDSTFKAGNKLSITSPSQSDKEVVTVSFNDNTTIKYLRGDIGVNFDNGWTQISDTQNNEYRAILGLNSDFNTESVLKTSIEKSNEIINSETNYLQIPQYCKDIYNNTPLFDDIEIKYHQKLNVVFVPTFPFSLSYLSQGDVFDVIGDTVVRAKDNSYMDIFQESAMFYEVPGVNSFEYENFINLLSSYQEIYKSNQSYLSYNRAYDEYVDRYYMGVPVNKLSDYRETAAAMCRNRTYDVDTSSGRFITASVINEYLKTNYIYSVSNTAYDNYSDPVDHFLFVSKSGHCALYASSMVLLLRSVGIPARYVTGFTTGGIPVENDGKYELTLKEKDFHAWVEVYFEGMGWLPFDPTGSSQSNLQTTPPSVTSSAISTSVTSVTTEPVTSRTDEASRLDKSGVSDKKIGMDIIIIAGSSVLLISLIVSLIIYAKNREKKRFARFNNASSVSACKEMYDFIFKVLGIRKICPNRGETPGDFADRADNELNMHGGKSFSGLIDIFEKVEFGDKSVSEEERYQIYKYVVYLYSKIINEKSKFTRFFIKLSI